MKGSALSSSRKIWISCMKALLYLCSGLTGALVLFLMGYVLIKGIPNISWELLSTSPSYLSDRIGILPDLMNTLYIVLATIVIVLPLGVGAAIYLTEYAKNKKLVAVMEYAAETLSGIPSIIYGLVGMLVFCEVLGMGTSLLGRRADACDHESSDHPAHNAGESQNGPPELPRGRVRARRRQMARGAHGGASRLHRRRHHRLHPERRAHSRRVCRAAVHRRLCPRAALAFSTGFPAPAQRSPSRSMSTPKKRASLTLPLPLPQF